MGMEIFKAAWMTAKIGVVLALAALGLSLLAVSGAFVASASSKLGEPPAVPGTPGVGPGVYLGAWVNPKGWSKDQCPPKKRYAGCQEFIQLPSFDRQVGRKMAILHVYSGWSDRAPVHSLKIVSGKFGAIPLLDWACGDSDARIAAGDDDQLIFNYAKALRSYGKPLFLRWFWEMNLQTKAHAGCLSSTSGSSASDYVNAWTRIWQIFHARLASRFGCDPVTAPISRRTCTVDVRNVAFVWCPSAGNKEYPNYFPPKDRVDWIAADRYSRNENGKPTPFGKLFALFYSWAQRKDPGAPIMIAETGSGGTNNAATNGSDQMKYLQGAAAAITTSRKAVKAFIYFDAIGPHGNWDLTGPGLTAFSTLGKRFTFGER